MSNLAVDIDQLQRLFATHQEIDRDPLAHHGDKPLTIVAVGLTASGKTSLLNLFLGSRLLAEGMGHTTMVPNAIIRGDTFQAEPLDIDGEPLPDFPTFPEAPTQLPSLPSSEAEWIDRLITNNRLPFGKQQKAWWDEVSQAAQDGRCSMVRITAPIDWLPSDVRIIEVPGYETWQENSDHPDERSAKLKGVVLSWFKRADHAIFVSGHDEFLKGNGPEFIREFLGSSRTGTSLIINKVDQAAAMDYDTTVARITERHYALLAKAKINGTNIRIFPVCAHPRSLNPLSDTLRADIIASLERLTGSLNATITDIRHLHSLDRDKEREDALAELYRKCRKEMAKCRDKLKYKLVSDEMAGHAKWAAKNAVKKLKISLADVAEIGLKKENAGIIKRCVKKVQKAVSSNLHKHMEPHIKSYEEDLREKLSVLIDQEKRHFISENLQQGTHKVSKLHLNSGLLMLSMGSIALLITGPIHLLILALFTPLLLIPALIAIAAGAIFAPQKAIEAIRSKLKNTIGEGITRDTMKNIWNEGMEDAIITAEIGIWAGIEYQIRQSSSSQEGHNIYSEKNAVIISTHSGLPITLENLDDSKTRLITGKKRKNRHNQCCTIINNGDHDRICVTDDKEKRSYAIDINSSKPKNGTKAVLSPLEDRKKNQQWIIHDRSEGKGTAWEIIHKKSGKALDVRDFQRKHGTQIQIWKSSGNANQRWFISATMARKDVTW